MLLRGLLAVSWRNLLLNSLVSFCDLDLALFSPQTVAKAWTEEKRRRPSEERRGVKF